MMQASDFADGHDLAQLRRLDRPQIRCILGEGKVGSGAVGIREIARQDATQVALAQDDDVVEAVAPDRPDQAFGEGILPRAPGSREDFSDLHALHALAERVSVNRVAIAKKIGRGGVVGESVHDLLSGLRRSGMGGDVEVQDPAPMVSEDDQDEEHAEPSSGNGEEVDRDQILDMVREERAPGLRRRYRPRRDQAGDGTLGYLDTEFQKLAMNSRRTP
jgi:hypothetical protein